MFVQRTDNRHLIERRFSQLSEEEQEAVAADLLERARAVIEEQKIIEGKAEEVAEIEQGSPPPTRMIGTNLRHRE